MQLVCPAGNFPSLKAAVDNGADDVYLGLADNTNARHFAGLNFNRKNLPKALEYAHHRETRVLMAINTYPRGSERTAWTDAIDIAGENGIDAVILADIGLLDYACNKWPDMPRHLSVQGSATSAQSLAFYQRNFGIQRAVLPRVLDLSQVELLIRETDIDIEVFGFGSLCIMVEGRCLLSSYLTGESPNTHGACSPAKFVRWEQKENNLQCRLNGHLLDQYERDEPAAYPTICKGRYLYEGRRCHALEEPTSLNTLTILPDLFRSGVSAIKIEGRQRSPAYVATVTRVWRDAIDACMSNPENFLPQQDWLTTLADISEGTQTTLGPYKQEWQ